MNSHNKPSDREKTKESRPLAETDYANVSNISGGITDEEFADEFLAYPAALNSEGAKFQFNFLGAELEKTDTAKNVRHGLKK